MNAASREALQNFRKFYVKPNDSWSADEIIEAVESLKSSVSRYVFRVENELEKFFYSATTTTSTTTMPLEEDIVGYDEEISLENYDEEREDKDEEDEDDNDYGSEIIYNY